MITLKNFIKTSDIVIKIKRNFTINFNIMVDEIVTENVNMMAKLETLLKGLIKQYGRQ